MALWALYKTYQKNVPRLRTKGFSAVICQAIESGPKASVAARPPAKRPPAKRLAKKHRMSSDTPQEKFTIAIEGCCHGELDKIYSTLQYLEQKENKKIDLLICCGDFQAVRNQQDLECMAVPPKYRDIMTFYKYYSGERKAPYPTLFIGGNHEASNYLWELYYGGWAAPNIYFMGYSGVVNFGGHRIAGLSGVYTDAHYLLGHFERPPYNASSIKSAYHVRELDVYRLMQLHQPVDIFLSHDWPRKIIEYGDKRGFLQKKSFLRSEVEANTFGSKAGETLLPLIQPDYWFSAHMHTKFPAVVPHGDSGKVTKFLALDKCLPGRDFLQVVELPCRGPLEFQYDEEWLAILRGTHDLMNLQRRRSTLPGYGALRKGAEPEDLEFVRAALQGRGGPRIPENFVATVAPYQPGAARQGGAQQPRGAERNPQTLALLDMIGRPYNLDHDQLPATQTPGPSSLHSGVAAANPEEISLEEDDDEDAAGGEALVADDVVDDDDDVDDGNNRTPPGS